MRTRKLPVGLLTFLALLGFLVTTAAGIQPPPFEPPVIDFPDHFNLPTHLGVIPEKIVTLKGFGEVSGDVAVWLFKNIDGTPFTIGENEVLVITDVEFIDTYMGYSTGVDIKLGGNVIFKGYSFSPTWPTAGLFPPVMEHLTSCIVVSDINDLTAETTDRTDLRTIFLRGYLTSAPE